ncbi:MAG: hypothetical protein GY812_12350 [Actinomycetia bacterium]|nr:hypothetical protein [Actinomycetes bacterium]
MAATADSSEQDSGKGSADTSHEEAPSLIEDLAGLLPRLIDRSSAQLQFSQSLLSMLPCTRSLFGGSPDRDSGEDLPEHEARQSTDVLRVLTEDEPTAAPDSSHEAAPGDEAAEAPDVSTLAIPDYDSLAASQVVPRLTTLSPEELEAVGAYESAKRQRRTILNRVTALLAD